MADELQSLEDEMVQYRAWADASGVPPEQQSGEWSSGYPGWDRINTAFDRFVAVSSWQEWGEPTITFLLYAIARDGENRYLVRALARRPDDLLYLAEHAVTSPERDARWQFAAELGRLGSELPRAENLLLCYVRDEEEYVRRIALMSLADIGSSRAEALALAMWEDGSMWQEYGRMATLYTLWKVGSPRLAEYLVLADADGRTYLVRYAARIRAGNP
ncbi:MAG TPA: HEAT repeat domain-containing protein [Ktedonobacterales bacterium]|jgi:hypothetical protein